VTRLRKIKICSLKNSLLGLTDSGNLKESMGHVRSGETFLPERKTLIYLMMEATFNSL